MIYDFVNNKIHVRRYAKEISSIETLEKYSQNEHILNIR